jgi:hypothetical protein
MLIDAYSAATCRRKTNLLNAMIQAPSRGLYFERDWLNRVNPILPHATNRSVFEPAKRPRQARPIQVWSTRQAESPQP